MKIGSVPVRCVVASLAFPASSASLPRKNKKGLKIPCTPLVSADRVAISIKHNLKQMDANDQPGFKHK